jgi:hypothetical protein
MLCLHIVSFSPVSISPWLGFSIRRSKLTHGRKPSKRFLQQGNLRVQDKFQNTEAAAMI